MNEWTKAKTSNRSFRDERLPAAWMPSGPRGEEPARPFDRSRDLWATNSEGFARSRIVGAIESARDLVCVASFLFSDELIRNAMLQSAARGVRNYLLTMSEQHLLKDAARETEFGKKQIEEHKATLDALAGHVLVRTAPHLHSKFVVVDPRDRSRARGFVSTANLTLEGLTRNVELVVALRGEAVRPLFDQFRMGFWSESEHELLAPGRLEALPQTGRRKVLAEGTSGLRFTAGGVQGLKAALLEVITAAHDEVWLFAYNISLQHEVTQALLARVKSGLKAHVFVRARVVNMPAAMALVQAGAEVRSHEYLHAKGVLARAGSEFHGLVMTANVETRGLDTGFETGVVLGASECEALRSILTSWSWFDRLGVDIPRSDVQGPCLLWDGKELRKARVDKILEMDLGEVEAQSITSMDETSPATLPEPASADPLLLPQEVIYRYSVVPPSLPRGARRLKMDGPLSVFELRGTKYVVATSPDRLEESLRVGSELGAKVVVEREEP